MAAPFVAARCTRPKRRLLFSVILAGVLFEDGTYGFPALQPSAPFRRPQYNAAPWIALLATIGIIYGAAVLLCPAGCEETGRVFRRLATLAL